jgi:hypothetical protein
LLFCTFFSLTFKTLKHFLWSKSIGNKSPHIFFHFTSCKPGLAEMNSLKIEDYLTFIFNGQSVWYNILSYILSCPASFLPRKFEKQSLVGIFIRVAFPSLFQNSLPLIF